MKNEKGITLLSLVITIILMIIFASVTTYTGIEIYSSMKEQAFVSKMIALQEKVDSFCDQYSVHDINAMGVGYSEAGTSEKEVLDDVIASGVTLKSWFEVDNSTSNYRYFNTLDISEKIGLDNFDVGIWLNPLTRNVIAVGGIDVDGVTYYRQYDLKGGQTLQAPVINTDTTLTYTVQTYDNKADIKLEKKYAKITCNLKNDTTIISSKVFTNTDTVTIAESGKYQLVATDSDKNTELEKRSVDFTVTIVNKPLLVDGMKPISEDGTELTTEEAKKDWYNYDSSVQKWANVKLKDGSVYVWIPRFAYKITDQTIDIKFLSEFSNITTEGKTLDSTYKVAPAFQNGVGTAFANGEWDNEILGFWIAKYEVTGTNQNGANALSDFPKSININKMSWGSIAPKDAFTICRNMEARLASKYFDTTKLTVASGNLKDGVFASDKNNIDTHLIKNSEWGAVAYLTWSVYGKNGNPTNKTNYYANSEITKEYCSTANNTTGVFGLVGGRAEMVSAGFNINEHFNSENVSTKYATVYANAISASNIIGDGMKETLSFGQKQEAPTELIARGGIASSSTGNGVFAYENKSYEASDTTTFRPVIIVEY